MSDSETTVLVVDDQEHVRILLRDILEGFGCTIVTANCGLEALDKLTTGNVDMVLLDIKMPGLDGFQTLARIRKQSDIPVMMVTALGEAPSMIDSISLGADDYLTKPFNPEVLLALIQARLKRAK